MKLVCEILKTKAIGSVYSITPSTTALDAVKLMADKCVGALLVMQDGKIAGIISERDYVRQAAFLERSGFNATVADIMTRDVQTVGPSDSSKHCMELMTNKRLRHLPVVEDGQLLGLVSIGDLVKDIISDQETLIQHLENYIRGE